MNKTEKKLLNLAQKGLPICEEPFQQLGQKLNLSVQEVIQMLKKLKQEGYIRRLGGVFHSNNLGYTTTLVAAKTPDEKLQQIADKISQYPGVTHCYRRNHELNLWFTLTVKNKQQKQEILTEIKQHKEIMTLYDLPKEKSFKLNVFFDMENGDDDE